MPIERKGRSMTASLEQLSKWLGRESGARETVTQSKADDLLNDLGRGLREARGAKKK
jgi:hypothetical protein